MTDTYVLFIITGILVIYDIWAAYGRPLPLLEILWDWLGRHPMAAFIAGLVSARLFWE